MKSNTLKLTTLFEDFLSKVQLSNNSGVSLQQYKPYFDIKQSSVGESKQIANQ